MRRSMLVPISILLAVACTDSVVAPVTQVTAPPARVNQGGVLHRVTIGGPDMCVWLGAKPGCDGNFSLVAIQREDGSVTGQWTDQFGDPEGMHAIVDCLVVQTIPGRTTLEAWIGGVATRPASWAGHRVITRARDNGTSAKDPLPDAFGRSIVDPEEEGYSSNCLDKSPMGLARVSEGQVTIE